MVEQEIKLLLAISDSRLKRWYKAMEPYEREGIRIVGWDSDALARGEVRYAIMEPYAELIEKVWRIGGLRYLVSVWAGMDEYLKFSKDWGEKKIIRAVGDGLQQKMVDYVVGMSLSMVLDIYGMRARESARVWLCKERRLVSSYEVAVLGLGKMGRAAAEGLKRAGFRVRGYSRERKEIDGIQSFAGGELDEAVIGADIVVCLLPLHDGTRGILGARVFEKMARGGVVINAGRGGHIDKDALLSALNSGVLSRAVLDVFEKEPLDSQDTYWEREDIVVTPHIASTTIPEDALAEGIRMIKEIEAHPHVGVEELLGREVVYDMKRGY